MRSSKTSFNESVPKMSLIQFVPGQRVTVLVLSVAETKQKGKKWRSWQTNGQYKHAENETNRKKNKINNNNSSKKK